MVGKRARALEKELTRLGERKERLKAGYRETFEHAGVGIAHVTPAGRFLEANNRFCEMMGLKPDALALLRFQDITFRDDVELNLSMLGGLLRGEIPGYRMQKRYVRSNGELFWADLTVSAVRDEEGRPVKLISVVNDITRQKADEERLKFLMGELSHRTKNLIAVIQAIVNQTCTAYDSSEGIRAALLDRLAGIAASQDALVIGQGEQARMRELVEFQLAVFLPPDDPRIEVDGPEMELCAAAVRAIGMALHELATNACKYGALSTTDGRVAIRWSVDAAETGAFRLSWSERGGPEVKPPTRWGFGRLVVEQMVATSTGGQVNLVFDPGGIEWTLQAPLSAVRA
jgi:PAS domain S-box-containing protein